MQTASTDGTLNRSSVLWASIKVNGRGVDISASMLWHQILKDAVEFDLLAPALSPVPIFLIFREVLLSLDLLG